MHIVSYRRIQEISYKTGLRLSKGLKLTTCLFRILCAGSRVLGVVTLNERRNVENKEEDNQ